MAPDDTNDDRLARLRATAHPLRLRMLSLLTGELLSAADLARRLDVTHANASYHLRQLAEAGRVELEDEVVVRGGRAKRYRYRAHLDRRMAGPPPTAASVAPILDALLDETRRRAADADFSRPSQVSDAELWVDPDTWADVVDRVAEAMIDLHDAARPAGTPGTIRTSTSVILAALVDGATPDVDRESEPDPERPNPGPEPELGPDPDPGTSP